MKENFISINAIIDRSGSMGHLTSDTIGGFNKFLSEQKAFPGEAVFTLCTFNDDYTLVHDFKKLNDVAELDNVSYRIGGGTALLDAVGTVIDRVGGKLFAMPEEERPSKVLFLIVTDGQENSSHRFTKAQVAGMIEHQTNKYNWEFIFMGANIDAVAEGTSLNVSARNSVNYMASSVGTQKLYADVTKGVSRMRAAPTSAKINFFDDEKADVNAENKETK